MKENTSKHHRHRNGRSRTHRERTEYDSDSETRETAAEDWVHYPTRTSERHETSNLTEEGGLISSNEMSLKQRANHSDRIPPKPKHCRVHDLYYDGRGKCPACEEAAKNAQNDTGHVNSAERTTAHTSLEASYQTRCAVPGGASVTIEAAGGFDDDGIQATKGYDYQQRGVFSSASVSQRESGISWAGSAQPVIYQPGQPRVFATSHQNEGDDQSSSQVWGQNNSWHVPDAEEEYNQWNDQYFGNTVSAPLDGYRRWRHHGSRR